MSTALETIVLGGGCFWCTEAVYVKVRGVTDVESGYGNGTVERPSYEQVCTGTTGHNEVVKLTYDPAQISLRQILEVFFVIHDPTTLNRQGADAGTQYRSGIYWQNEAERKTAEASRDALLKSGKFKTIHTELAPASTFWLAETYHQDYYKKNPIRYNYYRTSCGRDARVAEIWGGK